MPGRKQQPRKEWLDEGIRHLEALCKEAAEYADEGDILPTKKGIGSAVRVLQTFRHAHAPKIGVTVNGEIALRWENTSGKFHVYVNPDGSVQFYRNKVLLDERSFGKHLAAVPA
jgi:NADH:ubiquinone oxidoreductase subunit D